MGTAGIVFGLLAALSWGSGDFCGGLATRRSSPYQVLTFMSLTGAVGLGLAALIWHEPFPSMPGVLWSLAAGVMELVGIAALYKGLSVGNSAVVAPISAVIGAVLPVLFTILLHGLPGWMQICGFALGFAGIWLVSQSAPAADRQSKRGFWLACLAGLGFGAYFIFIAQVGGSRVFTPLLITRLVMFSLALILLRVYRLPFPKLKTSAAAVLAGILDAGANALFMLSKQFIRLDFAVIISGIYPAVTVILTALFFKEKVSLLQKIGIVCCLGAIALITL